MPLNGSSNGEMFEFMFLFESKLRTTDRRLLSAVLICLKGLTQFVENFSDFPLASA